MLKVTLPVKGAYERDGQSFTASPADSRRIQSNRVVRLGRTPALIMIMINSDRLLLRDVSIKDISAIYSYTRLPEMSKYDDWESMSEIKTAIFVTNLMIHASSPNRYRYDLSIVVKETNEVVGMVDLHKEAENSSVGFVGCTVNPVYQGKGYATEALRSIVNYGLTNLGLKVIYGLVEVENLPCIKIMEKIGMYKVGDLPDFKYYKGSSRDYARYEIIDISSK